MQTLEQLRKNPETKTLEVKIHNKAINFTQTCRDDEANYREIIYWLQMPDAVAEGGTGWLLPCVG